MVNTEIREETCPEQEKKGGTTCTGGYKRIQAVQPTSVAGGGFGHR